MKRLIIIRGNSGSGKSTIAKKVREKAKYNDKIAIVEQDYLRRFILKEKEKESENNIELIAQTATFALGKGYQVILEGILYSERYLEMLKELIEKSDESYIYYLDISLEESLKRHNTKSNKNDFGGKEIREWYRKMDTLKITGEKILGEELSEDEIVEKILADTKL